MRCPTCDGVDLVMSERQGIEIDYCPKCRGVWLDRGELDRIIERSMDAAPPPPASPDRRDEPRRSERDYGREQHPHKRRKSWLSELFD